MMTIDEFAEYYRARILPCHTGKSPYTSEAEAAAEAEADFIEAG